MDVELHIEELILDGFPALDRARLGVAVEQELGRLLGEEGVPQALVAGGAVARLDGGTLTLPPDAGPDRIGTQVAQAIYRGLAG